MPKNKKSLLAVFANNELKVGGLYKLYAKKFPVMKKFWNNIAAEEFIHSEILERAEKENGEREQFKETPYSRSVISYVSRFIDKELEKAAKGQTKRIDSIENALRLERSMIEKKSFEMFAPKNSKLKRAMGRLNRETQKHVKLLEKELKKTQARK